MPSPADVGESLKDARDRTLSLVEDLSDAQWMGPMLKLVNPLLWELGHVGWFQEHWVLRHARGRTRSLRDDLYDSSNVPHDTRWCLPVPSRAATLAHLREVLSEVLDGVPRVAPGTAEDYFLRLTNFHEDMHGEAFCMTRQTLGYPPPVARGGTLPTSASGGDGDANIPGGTFLLGSLRDDAFVFDNEKWAHPVDVEPFSIKRLAETQAEFAAFVDDRGYVRAELWSPEGWRWREMAQAEHPLHWQREGSGWLRRHFDRWVALEPTLPIHHVNHHEAQAYCRWARRRLPTELEWEVAAAGTLEGTRCAYPWGETAPQARRAQLDGRSAGPIDVRALPDGDSALGCRQLIGNVWEWTVSEFTPFPGFSADPYEDYSRPWFKGHQVLKGGSWATRARMIRPGYRNFYTPDRRDVFAGFRTCAER